MYCKIYYQLQESEKKQYISLDFVWNIINEINENNMHMFSK